MLIDVLRMPTVFGIPIDRRMTIYSGEIVPLDSHRKTVNWSNIPLYQSKLNVGTRILAAPLNVYKAVHISLDSRWVFETVFAQETQAVTCLYTKIISSESVDIGISLKAIEWYQDCKTDLLPISHFLKPSKQTYLGTNQIVVKNDIFPTDHIVPPVFGEKDLSRHLNRIMDVQKSGMNFSKFGFVFKPIYDHVPSVLEALIEGKFNRSPLQEVGGYHPSVEIIRDKWYNHEELQYMIGSRGMTHHLNHFSFDQLALLMMHVLPSKFSVTSLISNAIEGHADLWMTRDCSDPYQAVLRGRSFDFRRYQEQLSAIFYSCVMIYCKLYDIDYHTYSQGWSNKSNPDHSSITISKNIYDEITFTFHDLLHDRYMCFYSSFPALALTTLSVGWY